MNMGCMTNYSQMLFNGFITAIPFTGLLFDKMEEQQKLYRMIRKMQDDKILLSKISEYLDLLVMRLKKNNVME